MQRRLQLIADLGQVPGDGVLGGKGDLVGVDAGPVGLDVLVDGMAHQLGRGEQVKLAATQTPEASGVGVA